MARPISELKKQDYRAIIQISSILGNGSAAFFSAYAAARGGFLIPREPRPTPRQSSPPGHGIDAQTVRYAL